MQKSQTVAAPQQQMINDQSLPLLLFNFLANDPHFGGKLHL
jgi:hypothetical protein